MILHLALRTLVFCVSIGVSVTDNVSSSSVYKIWRGPLHEEDTAEVEWVFRPYMNTAYKRRFLSVEGGDEDEENAGSDEEGAASASSKTDKMLKAL